MLYSRGVDSRKTSIFKNIITNITQPKFGKQRMGPPS